MMPNTLSDVIVFCLLFHLPIRDIFAFQTAPWAEYKRSADSENLGMEWESPILGCHVQQLRSLPGSYVYSSQGQGDLCSLYLLAPSDHVIEMEFTYFKVDCEEDGAVALLDGWELDYEIFPSADDHPLPMSQRYLPFCGSDVPNSVYISKQNVAQLQFVVPIQGQGFRLKVTYQRNHKPCNMLLVSSNFEKISLRNLGLRRNCTALSLYPQRVRFLYVNVGEKSKTSMFYDALVRPTQGLTTHCSNREYGGSEDSVQVYESQGVGNRGYRKMVLAFCGFRAGTMTRSVALRCRSSSVRLQSSGHFYNTVRFTFLPVEDDDEESPQCLA